MTTTRTFWIAIDPQETLALSGQDAPDEAVKAYGEQWCEAARLVGAQRGYDVEALATTNAATIAKWDSRNADADEETVYNIAQAAHELINLTVADDGTWSVELTSDIRSK